MTAFKPCGTDPDKWFSTVSKDQAEAVKICNRCPFRDECRQYALDNDVRWGVWGGLTERDRRRIKRQTVRDEVEGQEPCGTDRALRIHRNRGETCALCQEAHEERLLAHRRQLLDEAHALGGTTAGAAVHRRLGEPVCPMCRAAQARDSAVRRERRNKRLAKAAA